MTAQLRFEYAAARAILFRNWHYNSCSEQLCADTSQSVAIYACKECRCPKVQSEFLLSVCSCDAYLTLVKITAIIRQSISTGKLCENQPDRGNKMIAILDLTKNANMHVSQGNVYLEW